MRYKTVSDLMLLLGLVIPNRFYWFCFCNQYSHRVSAKIGPILVVLPEYGILFAKDPTRDGSRFWVLNAILF